MDRSRLAVSIHAPLRGATDRWEELWPGYREFQSTHPCGVRQGEFVPFYVALEFQSTHPCGVRLSEEELLARALQVSIHAPLRGATEGLGTDDVLLQVSIHAPLRGATIIVLL